MNGLVKLTTFYKRESPKTKPKLSPVFALKRPTPRKSKTDLANTGEKSKESFPELTACTHTKTRLSIDQNLTSDGEFGSETSYGGSWGIENTCQQMDRYRTRAENDVPVEASMSSTRAKIAAIGWGTFLVCSQHYRSKFWRISSNDTRTLSSSKARL